MAEEHSSPVQVSPPAHRDWYVHPNFVGTTKGPVGGGCFSYGCGGCVVILLVTGIISVVVGMIAGH